MSAITIRPARPSDRPGIVALERSAFGRSDEADLVEALVADGDAVLELLAERGDVMLGHVLFSRLRVVGDAGASFAAVALAPLAVAPDAQRRGIGASLVEDAHGRLVAGGETLSVVLGEPGYYGRFGYSHGRASGFDSDYQCEALQALAWAEAPSTGRLAYPRAFGGA